jgi:hypothetical protein
MKENWKVGNYKSTVVSDTKQINTNFPSPLNPKESQDSDIEYYGGYLVCESVANEKAANIIAAAPKLLNALQSIATGEIVGVKNAKENLECAKQIAVDAIKQVYPDYEP